MHQNVSENASELPYWCISASSLSNIFCSI